MPKTMQRATQIADNTVSLLDIQTSAYTVISFLNDPPISPNDQDQYIIGTGTGVWLGYDNYIARYDANNTEWEFISPVEGLFVYVVDEELFHLYQNSVWVEYVNISGASPGFGFGRSGNNPTSTYLLNETVPSNIAGRIVPVDGFIAELSVAVQNNTTTTIGIFRNDGGGTFTLLTSITLTNERKKTITTFASVSKNDELAAQITSGSAQNVVMSAVIKGS